HGIFDNENAGDWAYRLVCLDDLSFVEQTLDRVLSERPEALQFWEGEEALAAAETVARLRGKWGRRDLGSTAGDTWVEAADVDPSPRLVEKARRALDCVASGSSNLARIWQDSTLFEDWLEDIADLKDRLR